MKAFPVTRIVTFADGAVCLEGPRGHVWIRRSDSHSQAQLVPAPRDWTDPEQEHAVTVDELSKSLELTAF